MKPNRILKVFKLVFQRLFFSRLCFLSPLNKKLKPDGFKVQLQLLFSNTSTLNTNLNKFFVVVVLLIYVNIK